LQSFFESVAEADSFGDGLKVIMKIAEQFKPKPLDANHRRNNSRSKKTNI
jgi:hypothetical protein